MTMEILKNIQSISNQRFERKFYLPTLPESALDEMLKHHPMRFRYVYPQRFVNNIYLDTFDLGNYIDNIAGVSKRIKVRIRWYGNSWGVNENPKLELKIKNNMLGAKISFPLKDFCIDESLSKLKINNLFKASDVPAHMLLYLKSLDLILMNRYTRKYYQSFDGRYRITIDSLMTYYRLSQLKNTFSQKQTNKNAKIVELKYNKDHDDQAKNVTCHFPFRVSKNSKYVEGINKLGIC